MPSCEGIFKSDVVRVIRSPHVELMCYFICAGRRQTVHDRAADLVWLSKSISWACHGAQVEEQTPLAAAEVYLFTWRGHLCFLPGLPWLALGRWHLPKPQVSQHTYPNIYGHSTVAC